jgi:hypothetical protein
METPGVQGKMARDDPVFYAQSLLENTINVTQYLPKPGITVVFPACFWARGATLLLRKKLPA